MVGLQFAISAHELYETTNFMDLLGQRSALLVDSVVETAHGLNLILKGVHLIFIFYYPLS
jgi:hypothetical protein